MFLGTDAFLKLPEVTQRLQFCTLVLLHFFPLQSGQVERISLHLYRQCLSERHPAFHWDKVDHKDKQFP